MSVQGKCISGHSRSRKGDRNMGKSIFKLRVYFDGLVIRKEVFSEPSNSIETHLDVIIDFFEIQSSVSFEFCLDEELIEFW